MEVKDISDDHTCYGLNISKHFIELSRSDLKNGCLCQKFLPFGRVPFQLVISPTGQFIIPTESKDYHPDSQIQSNLYDFLLGNKNSAEGSTSFSFGPDFKSCEADLYFSGIVLREFFTQLLRNFDCFSEQKKHIFISFEDVFISSNESEIESCDSQKEKAKEILRYVFESNGFISTYFEDDIFVPNYFGQNCSIISGIDNLIICDINESQTNYCVYTLQDKQHIEQSRYVLPMISGDIFRSFFDKFLKVSENKLFNHTKYGIVLELIRKIEASFNLDETISIDVNCKGFSSSVHIEFPVRDFAEHCVTIVNKVFNNIKSSLSSKRYPIAYVLITGENLTWLNKFNLLNLKQDPFCFIFVDKGDHMRAKGLSNLCFGLKGEKSFFDQHPLPTKLRKFIKNHISLEIVVDGYSFVHFPQTIKERIADFTGIIQKNTKLPMKSPVEFWPIYPHDPQTDKTGLNLENQKLPVNFYESASPNIQNSRKIPLSRNLYYKPCKLDKNGRCEGHRVSICIDETGLALLSVDKDPPVFVRFELLEKELPLEDDRNMMELAIRRWSEYITLRIKGDSEIKSELSNSEVDFCNMTQVQMRNFLVKNSVKWQKVI